MPAILKAIGRSPNYPKEMQDIRAGYMLRPILARSFITIDPKTDRQAMLTIHTPKDDRVTNIYIGKQASEVDADYLRATPTHQTLSHQESSTWPIVHRNKVIAQLFVQHQSLQCMDIVAPPMDHLPLL
jgi:hypothetical protein